MNKETAIMGRLPVRFTEYETSIIREIALHRVEPGLIKMALNATGYPVEKGIKWLKSKDSKILKAFTGGIEKGVMKSMESTIKLSLGFLNQADIFNAFRALGEPVTQWEEIFETALDQRDIVADRHDKGNAALITVEGGGAGLLATLSYGAGPLAPLVLPSVIVADIMLSMTILARHTCQIAASYGFDPRRPENLPHILMAMAPEDSSSDESFFPTKAGVYSEVRAAQKYIQNLAEGTIEREMPRIIQLLTKITARFNVALTEKELALLIPAVSVAINASVNLAFQQTGRVAAKDYFRTQSLMCKYGEQPVYQALENNRQQLLTKRK